MCGPTHAAGDGSAVTRVLVNDRSTRRRREQTGDGGLSWLSVRPLVREASCHGQAGHLQQADQDVRVVGLERFEVVGYETGA